MAVPRVAADNHALFGPPYRRSCQQSAQDAFLIPVSSRLVRAAKDRFHICLKTEPVLVSSSFDPPLEFRAVLSATHLSPHHATANFATRPSSVALPMICSSGISA